PDHQPVQQERGRPTKAPAGDTRSTDRTGRRLEAAARAVHAVRRREDGRHPMTSLDLATGAVLTRAANLIVTEGHAKDEFHTRDGYCSAGAIGKVCGLDPEDWNDDPSFGPAVIDSVNDDGGLHSDASDTDLHTCRTCRQAALDAARALAAHITPDVPPEQMSRRELSEH